MSALALYLLTFIIFLAVDYVGLSYLIKPIFERDIGHIMTDTPRLGPAFLFYAFFIAGVVYFASWPAIQHDHSLFRVFLNAALLGAMAYGTYEFTSLAVMKDWTWTMVLADLTWGTVLTGASATAGVVIMRVFA